MASPVPIYKGRDFYVPAFVVKVGGADIPKEAQRDVIDVRYTERLGEFESFEITVNNWDDEALDFKYTGASKNPDTVTARDQLFDPGQEVELWMGYFAPIDPAEKKEEGAPEPLRLMLAGIITSLAPTFPASGQPTLKVGGQSVLMKLVTQQETHTYDALLRDSDIAEQISERGSLTLGNMTIEVRTNAEAKGLEPAHPEPVIQANQYDILFLLQLAHQNGYELVLQQEEKNGETTQFLYFGPSTQEPPVTYSLEWGRSLVEFQPTLTTARQVNELTVRGWDAQRKAPIEVTVSRADLSTRPLRDEDRLYRIEQGFSARHEVIADRPFRNEQEARQFALGRLEALAKEMVTTRGSTLGTPGLRVGRKIEVSRLGPTFDGSYFIDSTTHTMGSGGYVTEFEARLEEMT